MPPTMSASTDATNVEVRISENNRRGGIAIAAIVGFVVVVVLVVVVVVGLIAGGGMVAMIAAIIAAAIAGIGVGLVLSYQADSWVLSMVHARPAEGPEFARYRNLVEGLCIAAGVPEPALYIVDDPTLNAMATGRNPEHGAIVATTGLLEHLTRIELEGVLAHELAHIVNRDTRTSTIAAAIVGRIAPGSVAALVPADREAAADVAAVGLTRYPPGLISALEKMRDNVVAVRSATTKTGHLWIVDPCVGVPAGESDRGADRRPSLEERIERLREV